MVSDVCFDCLLAFFLLFFSATGRPGWNLDRWLSSQKTPLKLYAISWFEAEWDQYVPELYKQLGF